MARAEWQSSGTPRDQSCSDLCLLLTAQRRTERHSARVRDLYDTLTGMEELPVDVPEWPQSQLGYRFLRIRLVCSVVWANRWGCAQSGMS